MTTINKKESQTFSSSDDLKVISVKPLGGRYYRITTESKRYGLVVQDVLVFPRQDVAHQSSGNKKVPLE